jgi:hypothetical protein
MAGVIQKHLPILIGILLTSFVGSLVVINYYAHQSRMELLHAQARAKEKAAADAAHAKAAAEIAAAAKVNEAKLAEVAVAQAAATEAKAIVDAKEAKISEKEQALSITYIEKMIGVKTQEVAELNSRLSIMNGTKAAKVDQAMAMDKEIDKLNVVIEMNLAQQASLSKQISNARSMLKTHEMDEHKGIELNMQVEELEKSKKMLDERFKESESRLTDNTAKQASIDTEIKSLTTQIGITTKNRNAVDADIIQLGNQYDEARIAGRANKAAEQKQAEQKEMADKQTQQQQQQPKQ